MSDLNTLVYQFLEKAAPSTAEAFKETASNIADAPATPTLTELVENHLKRGRDGGDTSSAAAAPAAKRVKQDSNSDSGSSGVPAQGGVALTDLEKAQKTVDSLEEEKKELRKLMGVVGDIQDDGHQITDVALKRRLWACGIVHFKNVPKVLKQLRVEWTSVNKQLESASAYLAVVRKQTAGELAERFKFEFRVNETQERPAYRGAEEAKAAVMPYIRGALRIGSKDDEAVAWNNVNGKNLAYIFATVGQMGKGKTRLQYELCRQSAGRELSEEPVKMDFGETHVNFVRLTYSEGFQMDALPGVTTTIFGRNLLMCNGMSSEDAGRVQSLEEAVELLYRKLTWPTGKAQALVVCVDEFLSLLTGTGTKTTTARGELMQQLVVFQEKSCKGELPTNRVVFLFAAVTEEMVEAPVRVSGRQLCTRNVPTIGKDAALKMLFTIREDLEERFETDTQFEHLVYLCLPRPRALFVGLLDAYKKDEEAPKLREALEKVAESNSVDKAMQYLAEEEVQSWLTSMSLCTRCKKRKELQEQWGVTAADESPDPLTLRFWCEVWNTKTWEGIPRAEKILPVARYLREAYIADTKVDRNNAKVVEEVLYNFEAAKRASYNSTKSFQLSEYYRGSTIKGGFENVYVFAYSAAPKDLVKTVTCFEKKSEVLKLLEDGCVVVSMLSNEAAIEYLVPFFDFVHKELTYVAAVQVKFSPDKSIGGGYKEICDKAMKLPIVKYLVDEEKLFCFPVLFSTSHGDMSKSAGEVERGVLYNETAMLEFTECLVPLRLHREKASPDQEAQLRANYGALAQLKATTKRTRRAAQKRKKAGAANRDERV